ncbi:MAG: hypothetical protein M3247_05045 [Thermoproteota archaeon]|nr:hypothetical protein [Thermoproteota archaeon]
MQSITHRKEEVATENGKETIITTHQNPLYSFMYALKSFEERRQYPKRLKMLFDYLGLAGSLEQQAQAFLFKARQNAQWAQDSIMTFLEFHKQRVGSKELAAGTLNYYGSILYRFRLSVTYMG